MYNKHMCIDSSIYSGIQNISVASKATQYRLCKIYLGTCYLIDLTDIGLKPAYSFQQMFLQTFTLLLQNSKSQEVIDSKCEILKSSASRYDIAGNSDPHIRGISAFSKIKRHLARTH